MKWSKAILRQYIATFSCLLCSVMTSVCFVWYTPLMVWLLDSSNTEIAGLDTDQLSWLVAIIEVGELLGPVPCGYIADRWGRKPCILMTFPLVILSWLITLFTRSLVGLYVARIIQGIAIGIFYTIGPIYVAEISQANMRGELGGHLQTMWFVGVLYSYCTGPFLSYQNYIIVSTIPAFMFLACFYFMPETPYFLMMSEKRKEAEESLCWLRGDGDVLSEMKSIEDAVTLSSEENGSRSGWKDLFFSKKCRKPLAIISIVCIVKYLGGTTTITNFATQTFSKSVDDPRDADFMTIIMGLVLIVTTIFAAFVSDRFGRKPLVICSTVGLGISSAVIAGYYYLERQTDTDVTNYNWFVYASIAAYCITYNLGLGPIQTTLQAEYFPSHVRAAAGGYTTIISDILCFVSIKQYQLLDDYIGVYSNFVVFAIVSFIGLFFLVCYMEETANKSLNEIQNKN